MGKDKKEKPVVLNNYSFPEYGLSIRAESLAQAKKDLESQLKQSNGGEK